MTRITLASASPRRRELIAHLGVSCTIMPSAFDEESVADSATPEEYVLAAAIGKAHDVARHCDGIVIGIDTDVVDPEGMILGKPSTPEAARAMLQSLAGRTHRVLSGVVVAESAGGNVNRQSTAVVETKVTMAPLDRQAIDAYIATGEPFDKAGGYGMQGGAMPFVTRIDGDPSNVIGIPLWTLAQMLREFDIPLWTREETNR
ncbi:MAG: Maf family protein [Armatimonadaceae bacterium]|jgi:septum formation protein